MKKKAIGNLKKGDNLYGIDKDKDKFILAEFVEKRECTFEDVSLYIVNIDGKEYGAIENYSEMETIICHPMLNYTNMDLHQPRIVLFTSIDSLIYDRVNIISHHKKLISKVQDQLADIYKWISKAGVSD